MSLLVYRSIIICVKDILFGMNIPLDAFSFVSSGRNTGACILLMEQSGTLTPRGNWCKVAACSIWWQERSFQYCKKLDCWHRCIAKADGLFHAVFRSCVRGKFLSLTCIWAGSSFRHIPLCAPCQCWIKEAFARQPNLQMADLAGFLFYFNDMSALNVKMGKKSGKITTQRLLFEKEL